MSLNDIFKLKGPDTNDECIESYIMLHEGIEQ